MTIHDVTLILTNLTEIHTLQQSISHLHKGYYTVARTYEF